MDHPDMLSYLRRIAPSLAHGIEAIERQHGEGPGERALYALYGPHLVADSAREHFQRPAVVWESVRNLVLFSPILWTWFSIAAAGLLYRQYQQETAATGSASFLAAWESGFATASAPPAFLSFSTVAMVSAVLVGLTMLATIGTHLVSARSESKLAEFMEAYGHYVRMVAGEIYSKRQQIENSRWAMLELLQRDGPENMRRAVAELTSALSFERNTVELSAAARERELDVLQEYGNTIQAISDQLATGIQGIEATYQEHLKTTGDLATYVKDVEWNITALVNAIGGVRADLQSANAALTASVGEAQRQGEEISSTVRQLIAMATLIYQSGQASRETMTSMAASAVKLEAALGINNQGVDQLGARLDGLARQLTPGLGNHAEAMRALENRIAQTGTNTERLLSSVRSDLSRMVDRVDQMTEKLEQTLSYLQTQLPGDQLYRHLVEIRGEVEALRRAVPSPITIESGLNRGSDNL